MEINKYLYLYVCIEIVITINKTVIIQYKYRNSFVHAVQYHGSESAKPVENSAILTCILEDNFTTQIAKSLKLCSQTFKTTTG